MQVYFSKRFSKKRDKLTKVMQEKLSERLRLFAGDPFHPLLNNHSVEKTYPGCRSINITTIGRYLNNKTARLFSCLSAAIASFIDKSGFKI